MPFKKKTTCDICGTNDRYKNGKCKACTKRNNAEWNKRNPQSARDRNRRWRESHPEKKREVDKEYRNNNPEKRSVQRANYRTRKADAGGSHTDAEWKALCKQYNNRCLRCGKKKKLTPDHIVPLINGGSNDISNIQPLCESCNKSKGAWHDTDYRTKPGLLRWIQEKLL